VRRKQPDPRGGQLDGQGQAVQAPADGGDIGGVAVSDAEAGPGQASVLDKQARGFAGRHLLRSHICRQPERRHRLLLLAQQVQRPPGRGQHDQVGRGRQQLGHHLGRAVQLLQVVQHEQGRAVTEIAGHHLRAVGADAQTAGDSLPHHLGIANSRQRDEEHSVRELLI
jgi:hypothetical protein